MKYPKAFIGEEREEFYRKAQETLEGRTVANLIQAFMEKSNIPTKRWQHIQLRPDTIDIPSMVICKDYLTDVVNQVKQGNGLFITGTPGNGKTSWTYKISQAYVWNIATAGDPSRMPVYFVNVPELFQSMKTLFGQEDGLKDLFYKIKESELVIFDDIGAENSTDWAKEQLYTLINSRYANDKACLFTSNKPLNALERRIADRIREMCTVVEFKAQSARGQ